MDLITLSSWVAFFCITILGSFMLFRSKYLDLKYHYFMSLVLISVWIIYDLIVFKKYGHDDISFFLIQVMTLCTVFCPVFFSNFCVNLVSSKNKLVFYCFSYGGAFLISYFLLFSSNELFFVKYDTLTYQVLSKGIIYNIHEVHVVCLILYSLLLLIQNKNNRRLIYHRQIEYITISTYFFMLTALIYFLLPFGQFNISFANIILIFYTGIVSYAITKKDLFDLQTVVSRYVSYFITSVFIIVSFLLLFSLKLNQLVSGVLTILLALTWTFNGLKLSNFLITTAKKKFLKGFIDLDEVQVKISKQLSKTIEIHKINNILSYDLKKEIEVQEIQLFIPNNFLDKTNPFSSFENVSKTSILTSISTDSPLISELNKSFNIFEINDPLILNPELNVFKLFVPIKHNNELIGIIAVGPKLNGYTFESKEYNFFEVLSNYITSFLLLSKPFEEIKENYKKSLEAAEALSTQAAFGTLAQGSAHEIYNPMGMLRYSAENLLKDNIDEKKRKTIAEMIIRNTDRLTTITKLMLKYGQTNSIRKKEGVDINAIVSDIVDLSQYQTEDKKIDVSKQLNATGLISADPNLLNGAILNLVVNGIQAIHEEGEIIIETADKEIETFKGNITDGVEIKVTDTGEGIEKDKMDQIFNSFYTTKHENTGLGLSSVKNIISNHDGTITIDSERGKYTTFIIHLPKHV